MRLMVDDLDASWAHIDNLRLAENFGVQPPKPPQDREERERTSPVEVPGPVPLTSRHDSALRRSRARAQAASATGSSRMITVLATGVISSAGIPTRAA
jgi:hypothetical protein